MRKGEVGKGGEGEEREKEVRKLEEGEWKR